jgi:hypothetical protein
MLIAKISTVTAVMLAAGIFCGRTNLDASVPKPSMTKAGRWKVQVTGQQLLTSVKGQEDVSAAQPVLSLKVHVAVDGNEDAILSQDQIRLVPASGRPCILFAIGSGRGEFDRFNFYASSQTGWFNLGYPKIDYKEKEDEAPVFGLRQPNPNKPHVFQVISKNQVILLGFRIPQSSGSFRLIIGDAAPVRVTVRP